MDFQENAQLVSPEKKNDGGLQGLPKTRLNLSAGGGSTRYSQTSMERTSGTNKQINKQKRHWTCGSEKWWGHLQTNPCIINIIIFDFDSNCRYTLFFTEILAVHRTGNSMVFQFVVFSHGHLKTGIFSKLEFPHFLQSSRQVGTKKIGQTPVAVDSPSNLHVYYCIIMYNWSTNDLYVWS